MNEYLLRAASFAPDPFEENSAWLGHIPFAAYLVMAFKPTCFVELGTHYGHSYFAFCKAVQEHALSSRCYAVDTWQGDEHAGRYGEDVYNLVARQNTDSYAGFSTLLRMDFSQAVESFADGSIDLLHIDGLHTYEAVRSDFETWLPKLSSEAVVLFHDTNVRRDDFGVWKFWAELTERYPHHFEFPHSFGLGVLQLGVPKDPVTQFGGVPQAAVMRYFAAIGERIKDQFEHRQERIGFQQDVVRLNQELRAAEQAAEENLAQLNSELERVRAELDETEASIAVRDSELNRLRAENVAVLNSTIWRLSAPLRTTVEGSRKATKLLRLAKPALASQGGVYPATKKAWAVLRTEGFSGIRSRARNHYAALAVALPSNVDIRFLQAIDRRADSLLRRSVLIVAELSIPQCTKYRVEQKREMLASLGIDCQVVSWTDHQRGKSLLSLHTDVVFYRTPAFPIVLDLFDEANRLGLNTYWEVDDLVFDRELLSTSRSLSSLDRSVRAQLLEGADLYNAALLRAERGIASTAALADAMAERSGNEVFVVENALDGATLRTAKRLNQTEKQSDGSVKIVYGSGTSTHNVDFEQAANALLTALAGNPKVKFRLIGTLDLPSGFDEYASRIERIPFCTYDEYLAHMKECDISIAPLEPTLFNDAKSNIKYLEASILQLPSVCSAARSFAEVIEHGVDGFACRTEAEWLASLTKLIDDQGLRQAVGLAAYSKMLKHSDPAAVAAQQLAPLFPDTVSSGRPRILSVNILYAPRSFGGATIVAEQLNRLIGAAGNLDIYVFTSLPPGVAEDYGLRRYEVDGVTVIGCSIPNSADSSQLYDNPEIRSAFAGVLAAVQPDLVHFHSIQGIGVIPLDMCTDRGVPYVVTVHDAWWLCGRQFMIDKNNRYCGQKVIDMSVCARCVTQPGKNAHRQERLHRALSGAHRILAPSQYFADFYVANGFAQSKVQVNKNGIKRPASVRPKRETRVVRFAYVGGNTELKGIGLVRRAFARLAYAGVSLVLVDNTLNLGHRSYADDAFTKLPNVDVVPAYNAGNIDDFFAEVDVLLFPTQCEESFGLTVREALARKVWVITSSAGAVIEDIVEGENGFIVPFGDDSDAWYDAMRRTVKLFEQGVPAALLADEPIRIRYFEEQAQELETIYSEVISEGRSGTLGLDEADSRSIPARSVT